MSTQATPTIRHVESTPAERPIRDVRHTTVCIVGGGPGGAVLGLLIARQQIPVVMLEAHLDFDREFRGDTIHPGVMEIMDDLGLTERLLRLPHTKVGKLKIETVGGTVTLADFGRLPTRHPYVTMIPQALFLEFIVEEAKRYASFEVLMGARARELIEGNGVIRGVRYQSRDGWHEIRALLTVGADGRFSQIRRLAGLEPIKTSPPMDVLWLRLPRRATDSEGTGEIFIGSGRLAIRLNRSDHWQVGYVIPKGAYQHLRDAGIESFRQAVAELIPEFADRTGTLAAWNEISLLSVESSRVAQWYRPGLLLIGDAAHVMSPVGGVGINYAIQDAVVAANVLSAGLKRGELGLDDLAAVQREREWPTRLIQALQALAQEKLVASTLQANRPLELPLLARLFLRMPVLRDLPARMIAFGLRRPKLRAQPVTIPAA